MAMAFCREKNTAAMLCVMIPELLSLNKQTLKRSLSWIGGLRRHWLLPGGLERQQLLQLSLAVDKGRRECAPEEHRVQV